MESESGGPGDLVPGHPVYDNPELTRDKHVQHTCMIEGSSGYLIPGTSDLFTRINTDQFIVNDTDIWLLTYPKSGTTWTWEILLHLFSDGTADHLTRLRDKFHSLGTGRIELALKDETERINKLNSCDEPRIFGSHLPDQFIPDRVKKMCKVIVVFRNPKDACVSFYHFHRMNRTLGKYTGSFSQFYKAFINNQIMYGSWFDYTIKMYEQHKNDSNYLFLKFEDMKKDLRSTIVKIAEHINKPVSSDVLERIIHATGFAQMKESLKYRHENHPNHDAKISPFMRKGEVSDWKNYFTVTECEHFDAIYAERMKDIELKLEFE